MQAINVELSAYSDWVKLYEYKTIKSWRHRSTNNLLPHLKFMLIFYTIPRRHFFNVSLWYVKLSNKVQTSRDWIYKIILLHGAKIIFSYHSLIFRMKKKQKLPKQKFKEVISWRENRCTDWTRMEWLDLSLLTKLNEKSK